MDGNRAIIEGYLPLRARGVVRLALLDVLSEYCRSIGTRQKSDAAVSALLLFKLGYCIFEGDLAAAALLSDAFRLYSRKIIRNDPRLDGLIYLSPAYDKLSFSKQICRRLRQLVSELKTRGARLRSKHVTRPGSMPEVAAPKPMVGTFGDLSDTWFAQDSRMELAYDKLEELPHFVPRKTSRMLRQGKK
jgi:hypothetical protein